MKMGICLSAATLLTDESCDLLKTKKSAKEERLGKMLKLAGTRPMFYDVSHPTKNALTDDPEAFDFLQRMKMGYYCISTSKACSSGGTFCWGCLARVYNSMVVLDRIEIKSNRKNSFIMALFCTHIRAK